MEVILKEDVAKLGSRGDVVKVAEGYGRNYLLPRKLAIQANEGNKAVIVQMKAASVRRSAKEKTQAEELSKQLDGVSVSFQRRSGEHDQLFGSVTSGDLADALMKKGFNLDRRKIQLHEPLKTVGEFSVPVKLHKDVTAHLKVVIEKEAVAEGRNGKAWRLVPYKNHPLRPVPHLSVGIAGGFAFRDSGLSGLVGSIAVVVITPCYTYCRAAALFGLPAR